MSIVLGALRIIAVVIVILTAFLLIVLASLLPFPIRGARASLWIIVAVSRLFNRIFNIRVNCSDVETLRQHAGFIFLNHLSYMETFSLLSLAPVRFLAAAELRRVPLIGWMAEQLGTIFVDRAHRHTRRAARQAIAAALHRSPYPPLVVYPEGKLGLGDRVNPFHYGIFETASRHEIPYLLCAVWFNRPDIVIWKGRLGERLPTALWRLATFRGRIEVELFPLEVIHPTPQDDPEALAMSARRAIADKLALPTDGSI